MEGNKFNNSKVYTFFDWVWKLMVLNVLVLLFSIGIITIVPAICAAFKTIKDTKENYTSQIFKKFLYNFRFLFRDTFLFSIILIFMVGVSGYAFLWYDGVVGAASGSNNPMDQSWLTIAMISITIVVLGILLVTMAFIQLPMVMTYFYYGFLDSVKLCFYMAFKYFMTTIIEVCITIISLFVLVNGLFTYHLLPVWLFFGISLPLYTTYVISRKFYRYVVGQTEDEDDVIDYQNKTINRETYEDENKTLK